MQYFTFLGTGKDGRYDTLPTLFRNEDKVPVQTPFIQEAVWKKFKDEITEICVFVTPEAKRQTFQQLQALLPEAVLKPIDITWGISFENFIPLLKENIRDDEIILDITHSFRSIPIRMMLSLTYVEQAIHTNINHIYYGQIANRGGQKQIEIEDLLVDYRMQKISQYLSEFNDTLTVNSQDWKRFVGKSDKLIKKFLDSMSKFNEMLELSKFNQAIRTVDQIMKTAAQLEEKPDQYEILIPLTEKIQDKLRTCFQGSSLEKKTNLIELLLKHHRYQIAATFADQLFREEIIRYCFYPEQPELNSEKYARDSHLFRGKPEDFSYSCNQYLIYSELDIYGDQKTAADGKQRKIADLIDDLDDEGQDVSLSVNKLKKHLQLYKDQIRTFYQDVRNRMMHGQSIKDSEIVDESVLAKLSPINCTKFLDQSLPVDSSLEQLRFQDS